MAEPGKETTKAGTHFVWFFVVQFNYPIYYLRSVRLSVRPSVGDLRVLGQADVFRAVSRKGGEEN